MALRIGIAGCGRMGCWHAEAVRKTPGMTLHSVFDVTAASREAAAEAYSCPTYADLNEFVDDAALDAVVVATPSHAHVEPTLAALRAGKHVLCEKPLVQTERQAKRLFDAAERAARLLMTFQNRREDEDFLTTEQALRKNALGELFDIRHVVWSYSDVMRTFGVKGYRPAWRSEAAYGGGALFDFGPHFIDQLLLLVPRPVESAYAVLEGRRWAVDCDDQFLVILRFAGGLTAVVEMMQAATPPHEVRWLINAEKGGFRYENESGTVFKRSRSGELRTKPMKRVKGDWLKVYRNFRDAVAGKAEPMIKPHETLRLLRVMDAARKSAGSGRVVAIDDVYAPAVLEGVA